MALPTLTPEQRAEALKKAAAARTARKELRDAIARGEQSITALGRGVDETDQLVGEGLGRRVGGPQRLVALWAVEVGL